jgi:hypothetical protein
VGVLNMTQEEYPPIEDWSPEARQRLVEEQRDELLWMLDGAFTEFCTKMDLHRFGFSGDDPVAEAVQWCLQMFVDPEREIDPEQLQPAQRSQRLFTMPGWWLSQKVGRGVYRRNMNWRWTRSPGEPTYSGQLQDLERTKRRLGMTLRRLHERVCSHLVGFWLAATERLRLEAFGASDDEPPEPEAKDASRRSLLRIDAQFRFQCLFQELDGEGSSGMLSGVLTLLRALKPGPTTFHTKRLRRHWACRALVKLGG